ncbi:glycerophosphodiester phosphodiesterase family protein [Microbacteriaceae bacterium 4G12]
MPRVIAHRGFAVDAPENTLLAFENALALGVTHLETDVRATRDGTPVLWHDRTVERLGGSSSARIADLDLAQLRAIDLGAGQCVATLREALEAFPDARFNIDVKSLDAADGSTAVIAALGAEHRVLLTSFSERRRARAVRALPGVATSASAPRLAVAVLACRLGLTPIARLALRRIDAVQMPDRVLRVRTTTPRMVRRLHRAVREVHVWTINDPLAMRALVAAGVDGVVTDRCDEARAALHHRG